MTIAALSEHLVIFVQQGDDARQIGNEKNLVAYLEVARLADSCRDETLVLSLE